jgi:hypothetical protein
LLGVGAARSAQAGALQQAYGEFRQAALQLNPDDQPESVNTDGWEGTQNAGKALFPGIHLI